MTIGMKYSILKMWLREGLKKVRLFYTVHAKERMSLRVIDEQEIINALENGEIVEVGNGKYEVTHEYVRIVFAYNPDNVLVTVITVVAEKEFQKEIRRYARRNRISCRQATRALKGVA